MFTDLRFAVRQLRKTPGFTFIAVLTLALGIGANTAIFSFINAFFLKNFTVKDPASLVSVYTTDERAPGFLGLSRLNFEDYRDQNQVFSGMSAYGFAPVNALLNGEPAQIFGEIVSGNFFDLLGVRAALGRTFLPEEYKNIGTHSVVVLGYSFWQTKLGGDRAILGRTLTLNGTAFTVIGVAPADFRGLNTLNSPAFWVTTASYKQIYSGTALDFYEVRRALLFSVVARLKPGVSLAQADASLKPVSAELARQFPNDNDGRGVRLVPLAESGIDPNQRQNFKLAGTLLLSLSGVVLLIACANIANLLLARANGRQREVALRLAIGADRKRLVRQFLTESTLLALLGGLAGLLLAQWTQHLLWSVRPPFFPQDFTIGLDGRVLGFGMLIALATGILFGLAPAWSATKPDLTSALKSETAGAAARAPLVSFRNFLVAGQIALSVIALVVAGLFIRSLQQAQRANVGWNTHNLALFSVDLGAQGYTPDHMLNYYRAALEKARAIPGVVDATIASTPLLSGGGFLRTLRPQGDNENLRTHGSLMSYNYVWPGYLTTMGIPLVAGRDFTEADDANHPIAVIINEHLAKQAWPNRSPLGQAIKLFGTEVPAIVVGVVKDVTFDNVGENPKSYVFFSLAQDLSRGTLGTLHIRTERDAELLVPALRKQLQSLDPALPFVNITTMDETIRQGLWASRIGAALLSVFGALALLLAAIGVYGIMSYTVGKRVREIGIRMAIGAQRRDVFRLILGQGLIIAATGLVVGLGSAYFVARYFQNFLFSVSAGDALTYLAIAAILAAVTLLACFLPARRATKVDPIVALRTE
ncbi:MAG TPA: ABC transporter permease [Opitutus sp.]|nr:ABC transporter permease [Opitutus sp.]